MALSQELDKRLTAVNNYLVAYRNLLNAPCRREPPEPEEVLAKARCQLAQARRVVHQLHSAAAGLARVAAAAVEGRDERTGVQPLPPAGPGYRVCFLNRFARGAKTMTACQRSIVVRSAKTREDAIEEAKKRFAELEGVPDWHLHATMIEVGALDDEPRA